MDTHNPYRPPGRYRKSFKPAAGKDLYVNGPYLFPVNPEDISYMRGLYRASIMFLDEIVADILKTYFKDGWRGKIAIFTADHGEEFY